MNHAKCLAVILVCFFPVAMSGEREGPPQPGYTERLFFSLIIGPMIVALALVFSRFD